MQFTVVGSRTFNPKTEQMLLDMASFFNSRGDQLFYNKNIQPITLFYGRMDVKNRVKVSDSLEYYLRRELARELNVPLSMRSLLIKLMPFYISILGRNNRNPIDMVIAYSKNGVDTRELEQCRFLSMEFSIPFHNVGNLDVYNSLMQGEK